MTITYLVYAAIGMLGLVLGFLAGFYVASYKSPRTGDDGSLPSELNFLAQETNRATKAADALLKQARLKRPPKEEYYLPQVVIDGELELPNPLISEIREIKQAIKIIRSDMEAVTAAKGPGRAPRNDHNQQSESFDAEAERPSGRKPEPIVADLFNFDYEGERAPPTGADGPQIKRMREQPGEDVEFQENDRQSIGVNTTREIIELYNLAVRDSSARERFREQVEPLRIGTVNAVERRQNPTLRAEFRETTDGDLFAFAISPNNLYAVVPRLGLTIEAVSYGAGALGEVFNRTLGHDSELFYSRYRVRRPAVFKRETEHWELVEAGELDLGPGD